MPDCPEHHTFYPLGLPWVDHMIQEHAEYRQVHRTNGIVTRIKRVLCPYENCPHPHVEEPRKRYLNHWRTHHQMRNEPDEMESNHEVKTEEEEDEEDKEAHSEYFQMEQLDWLDDPALIRGQHDLFRQAPVFPHFPADIFKVTAPLPELPASVAERNQVATIRTWIKKVPLTENSFRSVSSLRQALKPFIEKSVTKYDTLSTLSAGLQHLKYLAYDLVRQEKIPLKVAYWLHAVAKRITRQAHYQNQARVALVILDPMPMLRRGNELIVALRTYWDQALWPQMALGLRRWSLAAPQKTRWKAWCYRYLRPWIELSVRLTSVPVSITSGTQHTMVAPGFREGLEPRLKSHQVVLYWHAKDQRLYRAWVPTLTGKEVSSSVPGPPSRPRAEQQRIHIPLSPEISLAALFFWCMGRGSDETDWRFYGNWERPVSDLNNFLELELKQAPLNPHNFDYETKLMVLARQAQLYTSVNTGFVDLPQIFRFTQLLELGFSHQNNFYPTWHQWQAHKQAVDDFMSVFHTRLPSAVSGPHGQNQPCQRMINTMFQVAEHQENPTFMALYQEAQIANGIFTLTLDGESVLKPSTEQLPARSHRTSLFTWAYDREASQQEEDSSSSY